MITFTVSGIPRPGGSKTAGAIYGRDGKPIMKYGRVIVTTREAGKYTHEWRQNVAFFARQVYDGAPLIGPLKLCVRFIMPRPKGHYGTGRNAGVLKGNAPHFHTSKPDATKLMRSTEDSLKSILWGDDSQIAQQVVEKVYGDKPGAEIHVEELIDHIRDVTKLVGEAELFAAASH